MAGLPVRDAVLIGSAKSCALARASPRSGITMVGGMLRGLSQEDAARFSFLLATPVIFAAGVLKMGDLTARSETASAAKCCSAPLPASAHTCQCASSPATSRPAR